ncbi:MAG: BON domain-containing protein [Chloroflexi bacterium]|nr:BON domain-containing protein [Chloroflexota bacterium]
MSRPTHPTHYYVPEYYGPYRGEIRRSDADVRRDVESILFYDSWVPSEDIKIDVKEGVVTLAGTVRSAFEKRAAGDDAWDVPGVRDVCNNLTIVETPTVTHG